VLPFSFYQQALIELLIDKLWPGSNSFLSTNELNLIAVDAYRSLKLGWSSFKVNRYTNAEEVNHDDLRDDRLLLV
jgi:hypothetical protein